MEVVFERGRGRWYHSSLRRPDGVLIRFHGQTYNRVPALLPHDIAHLVVEARVGLRFGVWGLLAAGALFSQTEVVDGRQRPHAARRGHEIIKQHRDELIEAEYIVHVVCRIAEAKAESSRDLGAWFLGRWRPPDLTPEVVQAACARLRELAAGWADVAVEETLAVVEDGPLGTDASRRRVSGSGRR